MSIKEWFRGTDEEKAIIAKGRELERGRSKKRRDGKNLKEGTNLRAKFRNRTLGALGGGALILTGGAAIVIASNTEKDQPALNSHPTDNLPVDISTPEMDSKIELPEFSIKNIDYKPSVPDGLNITPSHFNEIGKNFFNYIEKDFSPYKKDFEATTNPQEKIQLVTDHIIKYYDHLLTLDPKIRAHANSRSMGTYNERCSYMTLFLIGQGRYIGVMNPDPERPYPHLLYGKSKITQQIDVAYKGQHVELPIVEIDARAGNIQRAWYDTNNQLMMYSPEQTAMEARAMIGAELTPAQVSKFTDSLRTSTLKHEGMHALSHRLFPKSTTDASFKSSHHIPLAKQVPSTTRDLRHTIMRGTEVSELTSVGVEMANFPNFLKLYLSKMIPQAPFPDQYQQAYIHFLTNFANRKTIPLPLRRKVQDYLSVFPNGNPATLSEVMMDPSLPETELVAIGNQLFATGIGMFEHEEKE